MNPKGAIGSRPFAIGPRSTSAVEQADNNNHELRDKS